MEFLTTGAVGLFLTVLLLCLCFGTTVMVEFSWGSSGARRITIGAMCIASCAWFAIIVARFMSVL